LIKLIKRKYGRRVHNTVTRSGYFMLLRCSKIFDFRERKIPRRMRIIRCRLPLYSEERVLVPRTSRYMGSDNARIRPTDVL
jgi:hypothetical protein